LVSSRTVAADERTDLAISALEFGGSLGHLLWTEVKARDTTTMADANLYQRLALRVREQIEEGRASSSLVRANFDVVGTALIYAAVTDPEPLSKSIAGLGAWAAKKTGDAVGQLVIESSRDQTLKLLARGLQNERLSTARLKAMTPDQFVARVGDLKIGGQSLRDTFRNEPDMLAMVQAHATDIALDIGVEAISRQAGTAADVKALRADLTKTKKVIAEYQAEMQTRLTKIESHIVELEATTTAASDRLALLANSVKGNSQSLQLIARISYSGWTTSQKLQAVEGGLFSGLATKQQAALIESLKADSDRENTVAAIQSAARDFGNLATIVSNIGLPKDVITGLQGAELVASGIAKFATGDLLGGLATVTSLIGLGKPDAGARRHAEIMKYLGAQFSAVHQKLDKIIELQVHTFNVLVAFMDEQRRFQREILGQLDRVEETVLRSEQLLQTILLNSWTDCYALINGTKLNGQFSISTRSVLVDIFGDPNASRYAGHCYATMIAFFDAWIKPATWSGQLISAKNFPEDKISDPSLQRQWNAFREQRVTAYAAARDFVLRTLPSGQNATTASLARFSQPVADVYFARKLESVLRKNEFAKRFQTFKCNESDVLSVPLKDLLCFGVLDGAAKSPLNTRWNDLLNADLIGPQSMRIIDTGITLSALTDFAVRAPDGSFTFPPKRDIEEFSRKGPSEHLKTALGQGGGKGIKLLERLRWLSEMMVLQQAITYGDYTAQLIVDNLYDPATRSLNIESAGIAANPVKMSVVDAMKSNPVLARNVVMLSMRRALADKLGSADKAELLAYNRTFYSLALKDLAGPQACSGGALPRQKLDELFPNWKFEYYVTAEQRKAAPSLGNCPLEYQSDLSQSHTPPGRGAGIAVALPGFYILVPSPLVLSGGVFEESDSLRLALAYRDRINQAIVDRTVARTLIDVVGKTPDKRAAANRVGMAILNEGWNWSGRKTK
jgi:hypothetical protein